VTAFPVKRFTSDTGVRIYRLSCQAFPGLVAHTYVLVGAGPLTLVDTGSGYGESSRDLMEGFETLRREFGEPIGARDIERVIITHGHLDHFGGITQLAGPITAKVGIHELDRWVLTGYEERVVVATKALRFFLGRAGTPPDKVQRLLDLYTAGKRHVKSVAVDFTIEDGQMLDGMEFIHVPGHCPGQVCIRIGDVLLSADHVLPKTTPHQSPESITAGTGLGHYLTSLTRIGQVPGIRLALGGHEDPIESFYPRLDAIRQDHERKLARILDHLNREPMTMEELTVTMYPTVTDWHVLLAIEEVGSHVEYLYERGALRVVNLDEVEREANPPLEYAVR
jgi:glyoxylase-like metal-dependent hydrolase (beta-lactamase superfamily II)